MLIMYSGEQRRAPMKEHGHSIGEAAMADGPTVKAIRYYVEIGLIPQTMRRYNGGLGDGYRFFTDADVGQLHFIHDARAPALGLAEMPALNAIADDKACPHAQPEHRAIPAKHLEPIKERIEGPPQLRSTLKSIMDAEPSRAGSTCTWETCDCMDAAADHAKKEGSVSSMSNHSQRTGGCDV